MEVTTINPKTPVTITGTALAHLRQQLATKNAAGLRLGIVRSGCSGYTYRLDWVQDKDTGDLLALPLTHDMTLYISAASLPLVHGTEIDYVTEGLNSFMRFRNPKAHSECGCGESFALDPVE